MLYMVECRFTDPQREQAWSDWYSGVRLDELLAVPGFLASQRFVALTRPGHYYLAVHSIDSLDVFQRAEYKSMGGGGFQGYQECITDWVRRFFEGIEIAPNIGRDEALVVIDAPSAEAEGWEVALTWLRPVGANDHGGPRGIGRVTRAVGERLATERRSPLDVYVPLIDQRSGPGAAVRSK